MGALMPFQIIEQLDNTFKYLIYTAKPINLSLWRYES